MNKGTMVMTLSLDVTLLDEKIAQLTEMLKARFPEGIPDGIESHLTSLCNDIVFAERSPAVDTGCIGKIVQRVDFGGSFDVLTAAIRAGDFDVQA